MNRNLLAEARNFQNRMIFLQSVIGMRAQNSRLTLSQIREHDRWILELQSLEIEPREGALRGLITKLVKQYRSTMSQKLKFSLRYSKKQSQS